MKFCLIAFLFSLYSSIINAQQIPKNKVIKFSIGRVAFGTGDVFGYSFSSELSKNLKRHINFGFEATVENGKVQPKLSDVLTAFNQVSNACLTPKINFYPFNKVIKGFNIGIGPTLGYQFKTEESQWTFLYDSNGNPFLRRSVLKYTNEFFIGYRISLNYDLNFQKGFLLGIRSDFSSYNNGDINTLIAVKTGFSFR
ncbi:MAG: hypothetical protein ACR2KB_06380 [Chitinophagaceae bacterium]|jgi:hypothetical protein